MESNKEAELKILRISNELNSEIIGHKSTIAYLISNSACNISKIVESAIKSEDKDAKGNPYYKLTYDDYHDLKRFMVRLSKNQFSEIDPRIREEQGSIDYKAKLLNKLI